MKRVLFCIVMQFCICMAMNAQGLKTYSGSYNMVVSGFHFPGKATYTYKNADDGTRIYEGNFNFIKVIRPNVCFNKVVGKFHDDMKNGLWTYTNKTAGGIELLKICYSEGVANGTYEYSKTEKNVTKKSFKGIVKNGVPIGAFSGKLIQAYFNGKDYRFGIGDGTFAGQTDEKGLPDGTWKFTSQYYEYYEKWDHGVFADSYCIEKSTGDKYIGGESSCICSEIQEMISRNPFYMEYWIDRGCSAWDGIILDKRSTDAISKEVIDSEKVNKTPKSDYEGYSNDEEFIQAKSTIPNILYKLNGTKVDCVIDEHGNVTDIQFTQEPRDPAVAEELVRCLGLLKYKPAIYKGMTVKCKWGFWYDGNKSLLTRETKEESSAVEDKIQEEQEAQRNKSKEESSDIEDKIFDLVEQMPSFPGGGGTLINWLDNNIQYPETAKEMGVQGRVIVKFIVEKDGSISNAKVSRSLDTDLDNEALRLVKSMPKWNPGKQNGTEARVRYSIPVNFRLQ